MKKKNNLSKELKLKKTIVAKLNPKEMDRVVGGLNIKITQTKGDTVKTSTANDCGTVTVSTNDNE